MLAYIEDEIPINILLQSRYMRLKSKNDLVTPFYQSLLASQRQGVSLSDSFKGWVRASEYALLKGSSDAAGMSRSLKGLVKQTEALLKITSALKSKLIAPIILSVFFVCILFGVAGYLVPYMRSVIEGLVQNIQYAPFERAVFSISDFISAHTISLFVIIALIVSISFLSLSRWSSKWRRYVELIPPWSIYKLFVSSSLLLYISSMVAAEKPLMSSLLLIKGGLTKYLDPYVSQIIINIMSGRMSYVEAMDVGIFSEDVIDLLFDFSKTTSFETALSKVGQAAIERALKQVESFSAKLSVFITFAIIFSSAFFLFAIIAVILNSFSSLRM